MATDAPRSAQDEAVERLVCAAASGDGAAFTELYRLHHRLVRGLVRAELHDPVLVDDVVQEVFAKAWRRLPSLLRHDRFRAWLLQIARRCVTDHRRSTRRDRSVTTEAETIAAEPDPAPSPEEIATTVDLAERISRAIAMLPPRDAAVLRLLAGAASGGSRSEAIGVSEGAFRVAAHRARGRLRALLDYEALSA